MINAIKNMNKGTMFKTGGMILTLIGTVLTAKGDDIVNRMTLAKLVKETANK